MNIGEFSVMRAHPGIAKMLMVAGLAGLFSSHLQAQFIDQTLAPNNAHEGIAKSFTEEIGAGRSGIMTPDSCLFLINRDPFRAIRRGRQLFNRKFTRFQGQGPITLDGRGDIGNILAIGAGLADSCAACHARPRGSAGFGGDVVTRPDSRDVPHLFGLGVREMLADEITADLRNIRSLAFDQAQAQNKLIRKALLSKGISYGYLKVLPDGTVNTDEVQGVDPDLRVRPFFAQGGVFGIREFSVGAMAGEMGMQAADPDLAYAATGGRTTTPAGLVLDGSTDTIQAPPTGDPNADPDGDGVANEMPVSVVDFIEFYLLNYFEPGTYEQTLQTQFGFKTFRSIGCASCHIPDLPLNRDRRVADVETAYDPAKGIFNNLFATVNAQVDEVNDGTGLPTLKLPRLQPTLIKGIYTDFKRHNLGPNFYERNYNGTIQSNFLTRALWGVGSTAPYGHDGRSINLTEVILRHGGEALAQARAFDRLPQVGKDALLAFLQSLIVFPPDDTASNLDPGDRSAALFPQFGHGSIKLTVLFNNPADRE